ncbi:MAG TPA: NYN domain-containing protein [Bacteroidia bacterium]|nr:NYN domain-containing protein [Bacteroidia bacterium]
MKTTEKLIAVLIDGDNANPKKMAQTLAQIEQIGTIALKRVYGDFSQQNLNVWKDCVNKHSIKAIQSFAYTKGKNSTDIALIIDAMDILHEAKINSFCIVSSDCDFTGLIHRIKENGMYAIGCGKDDSCISFKTACDEFILEEEPNENKTFLKPRINKIKNDQQTFKVPTEKLRGLKILGKMNIA